jgi:hypothetical protein
MSYPRRIVRRAGFASLAGAAANSSGSAGMTSGGPGAPNLTTSCTRRELDELAR